MNLRGKLFTKITDALYDWDIHNSDVTEHIWNLVLPLLEGAFDEGVSVAGHYGHEDNWDSDNTPYNDNPYRGD